MEQKIKLDSVWIDDGNPSRKVRVIGFGFGTKAGKVRLANLETGWESWAAIRRFGETGGYVQKRNTPCVSYDDCPVP